VDICCCPAYPGTLSMNQNRLVIFIPFILCVLTIGGAAQRSVAQNTVITGVVIDAKDKLPVPNATISVIGSTQGTSTGTDGRYRLVLSGSYDQIRFSFVGYTNVDKNFLPGREQVINVALRASATQLQEVTVKSGKKQRYSNRVNPAVELIKKVIAHKPENRPESYVYQQYTSYEKMMFCLSNLSEKFMHKRIFKNYQFLFREQDSTAIGGKNVLPLYMEEKLSDNFISSRPEHRKQIIRATKQVKYDENFVDNQGLQSYFNRMYQDIDIYDNNISLLSNQLLSPIADNAPGAYKFFITDTIKDQSPQLVELSFTPRNTTDMLFEGRIYITLDGHYAVEHAVLSANKNINLNFVRRMEAILKFDRAANGKYFLSNSDLKIDFGINKEKGGGIFGERTVVINGFQVTPAKPASFFEGKEVIVEQGADEKTDEFWTKNRLDTLTTAEAEVYRNIDSLQTIPSFRRTMDIATLLLAGYKNFGWFEVGPVNTFYSINPVEGFRLRLGGRTSPKLSKRYYFETYAAYGFKDEKWKYFLSGTYSFDNKYVYDFPQNYLRGYYEKDISIPGNPLQFVLEDNLFLSFKRGSNQKYLYNEYYRLDYVREFENHFSYSIGFRNRTQSAAGQLYFNNLLDGKPNTINNLTSTELTFGLRYAPHEEFYQGRLERIPIPNKYPVLALDYTEGLKNVFNSSYGYQTLHGRIDKHLYLSQLGYADITFQAAHTFGQLPYPLLTIHRGNQTYSYNPDPSTYNLMNFLEFVSDHYESISYDQHLNGVILNKVPLFKRLKWRETIGFRALWGGVRDENNPALHPNLYQFPLDGNGRPITYTLGSTPYLEGSVGVENIFKFFGVSLVRRFNYLDHPDAIKYGFRTSATILF